MTSRIGALAIVTLLLVGCLPALRADSISRGEWPNYGNDAGGTRYSPLTQIDRENVARLRVAWSYRTGETVGVPGPWAHYAFEATPLMVDDTLFFSTPYNRVIALDAETGKERWAWDAKVDRTRRVAFATSRGVSTWLDDVPRAERQTVRRDRRRRSHRFEDEDGRLHHRVRAAVTRTPGLGMLARNTG